MRPDDLMLIDLSLEDGNGIHLVRALRVLGVEARVLVVTGVQSRVVAAKAFSAGVAGYVLQGTVDEGPPHRD